MERTSIPDYSQLLWPTVEAVRSLGGSGSIEEIVEAVLQQEDFTEEQQQVLHGDGPQTEVEYRLAWARTYLKFMRLLINSRRGVWTLTEEGRSVIKDDIPRLHAEVLARLREEQRAKRQAQQDKDISGEGDQPDEQEPDWREQLLDVLMSVTPNAFERLSQRLLREAGFISATVTGRTGDGPYAERLRQPAMSTCSAPSPWSCMLPRCKD